MPCCANCGKGEDESHKLKNCACKMVKYCTDNCQKAHRHKHKAVCKERLAELLEEELFKQPPPLEDCPICFLPLPSFNGNVDGTRYMNCCGKILCNGCCYANHKLNQKLSGDDKCPFCRSPAPKLDKEIVERLGKRIKAADAKAVHCQANYYLHGEFGFPQNIKKALELFQQSGELGYAPAYSNIGVAYIEGKYGVEKDEKKARHYFEIAALRGDAGARHNLGNLEVLVGQRATYPASSINKALKHYMIAVKVGCVQSLNRIRDLYKLGYAKKDFYAEALRCRQAYLLEIKSDQRDAAAAFNDEFLYY
jgi:TPR repeat protein